MAELIDTLQADKELRHDDVTPENVLKAQEKIQLLPVDQLRLLQTKIELQRQKLQVQKTGKTPEELRKITHIEENLTRLATLSSQRIALEKAKETKPLTAGDYVGGGVNMAIDTAIPAFTGSMDLVTKAADGAGRAYNYLREQAEGSSWGKAALLALPLGASYLGYRFWKWMLGKKDADTDAEGKPHSPVKSFLKKAGIMTAFVLGGGWLYSYFAGSSAPAEQPKATV
jgi:hypothetical protein